MATWSPSITLNEVPHTRIISGDSNGIKASVTLQCAASDIWNAFKDLLGSARAFPFNSQLGINLYCTAAQLKTPTSEAYTTNAAEETCVYNTIGFIDVTYSTKQFHWTGVKSVVTDPATSESVSVTERIIPSVEMHTYKQKGWIKWASTGDPLDESYPAVKQVHRLQLERTVSGYASLNSNLLIYSNFVNNADYTSSRLGITFQEETLMYSPPEISKDVMTGKFAYTVRISHKDDRNNASDAVPKGWNYFYNPNTNTWDSWIDDAGNPVKPYPPASMSWLLF